MATSSETSGKNRATTGKSIYSSRDTKYTSSNPIRIWTVITVALGIASRMIVEAIGFSSSMRVRESRSPGWLPGCPVSFLVLAAFDGRRGNSGKSGGSIAPFPAALIG